jgi:hypothetical protein
MTNLSIINQSTLDPVSEGYINRNSAVLTLNDGAEKNELFNYVNTLKATVNSLPVVLYKANLSAKKNVDGNRTVYNIVSSSFNGTLGTSANSNGIIQTVDGLDYMRLAYSSGNSSLSTPSTSSVVTTQGTLIIKLKLVSIIGGFLLQVGNRLQIACNGSGQAEVEMLGATGLPGTTPAKSNLSSALSTTTPVYLSVSWTGTSFLFMYNSTIVNNVGSGAVIGATTNTIGAIGNNSGLTADVATYALYNTALTSAQITSLISIL